jgi:DNA-binding SARP family transcriptional activator/tetratricopeptide (TPR) repeat protein
LHQEFVKRLRNRRSEASTTPDSRVLSSPPTLADGKRVRLALLGGFQVRVDQGQPVTFPSGKVQALLAFLALPPGRAHARDTLATLLWGGLGEVEARASLRQALFMVRKALPALPFLVVEGDSVALDPATVEVDLVRFERRVADGTPPALEEATALYQGDLLAGLAVSEPAFEEWLLTERERLRELAIEALAKLLAHHRQVGVPEAAVQTGLRLLALDPSQEPVHRTLMRLYARQGRRSAALKQYQVCVGVLRRELGTEPELETRRLYQDILQQRVRESAEPEARPSRMTSGTHPTGPVGERPLIGREGELAQLRRALDDVRSGLGRVFVIVGEAGVGKSSLVTVLGEATRDRGARALLGRCYESQQVLPFGPWVDALRGGGVSQDAETLQGLAPVWRAELSRLLPEVGAPDLPAPSDDLLQLFESVAQLVERLTSQDPLALVLEDLHWADEMSLRLFAFVARRMRTAPVLIAATAREEDLTSAPALQRVIDEVATEPHFVRMPLSPLSRSDTAALVRSLARRGSDEALVARLSERLWATSEGNPFVIVETMRALDDGALTETAPSLPLPERVRQVVAARLERLSQRGQQLAAVAAVIGREFEFPVLQSAAGLGFRDAAEGVEELVRRRVLHGIGERFDFTHERVREVVHGRLLALQRKVLHGQLAKAIEEVYAENLEPHYAALGLHCTKAENWGKAAMYLRQAGTQAGARSAYSEAAAFFTQALEALGHLPANRQTTELTIDIRLDIRSALIPLSEWTRMGEQVHEAERLARTLGDQHRLGKISNFMLNQCLLTGDYDGALRFGREALAIARALGDRSIEVVATTNLGGTHSARGEFSEAAAFFERNIALEGDLRYERFGSAGIQSAWSGAHLAEVLSELGRFDEAIERAEASVQIAEGANNSFTLSFGLFALGRAHFRRGDHARATSILERGHEVCRTRQIVFWTAFVAAALGVAYALASRTDEALPLVAGGVEEFRRRPNHFRPAVIPLYAGMTYLGAGRIDAAASHAREALALTRRLGACAAEAHAACLAGDVALAGCTQDAPGYYREALALAEPRGMRPLVAHCHLGLGTLYRRTGQREQAQEHLTTATTMYREMGMTYWLEKAEAELRQLA